MHMLRFLIIALFATTAVPLLAVQLRVQGVVTELHSRKPLPGALVRIYKNGEKVQVMHSGALGRYNAILDNNASYIIRFSMPGHVTKCFAIETFGPAWENDHEVKQLEVEMTMFESVNDLDLSFFDLPLGIARFTPMTGVISWNGDYELKVQPEVDRLMYKVALRREQLATLDAQRRVDRQVVQ